MFQVRFHGRGGQGVVTAAELLAAAAFREDRHAQAFPSFGFPQPTGEFEELAADCLVLALGQDADLAVLDGVPGVTFSSGTVEVGPDLMTGHPGIFAGGDMAPAERTVTVGGQTWTWRAGRKPWYGRDDRVVTP